jgi:hypothetical protein
MEKCPICSSVLPHLSGLRPGRPRRYCSPHCRRRAERDARRRAVRLLWAKRMLSLSPVAERAWEDFWGREDFERRRAEARALLEAGGSGTPLPSE